MKFTISRTSLRNESREDTIAPCPRAYAQTIQIPHQCSHEYFTRFTPEFVQQLVKIDYVGEEVNYTEAVQRWYIDFDTIEDLMIFVRETGTCILHSNDHIEIYDDWRE